MNSYERMIVMEVLKNPPEMAYNTAHLKYPKDLFSHENPNFSNVAGMTTSEAALKGT